MAAINQPGGPALTVRDAAAACRLSSRTIRRKLTAGSFPNAYKTGANGPEREGIWMIPVADLEAADLEPTSVHPTLSQSLRPATEKELEPTADTEADDGPTVLELVRSDRFGRLRAELAEAVAAAEIALLRAEAERWRVLAEERGQALDRADSAIQALTTAMGAMNAIGPPPNAYAPPAALPAPAPVAPAPQPVAMPPQFDPGPPPQAPSGDIVAVPPLVRAEAMRYTASLRALHEARKPTTKWWQFWKA